MTCGSYCGVDFIKFFNDVDDNPTLNIDLNILQQVSPACFTCFLFNLHCILITRIAILHAIQCMYSFDNIGL